MTVVNCSLLYPKCHRTMSHFRVHSGASKSHPVFVTWLHVTRRCCYAPLVRELKRLFTVLRREIRVSAVWVVIFGLQGAPVRVLCATLFSCRSSVSPHLSPAHTKQMNVMSQAVAKSPEPQSVWCTRGEELTLYLFINGPPILWGPQPLVLYPVSRICRRCLSGLPLGARDWLLSSSCNNISAFICLAPKTRHFRHEFPTDHRKIKLSRVTKIAIIWNIYRYPGTGGFLLYSIRRTAFCLSFSRLKMTRAPDIKNTGTSLTRLDA